MKDLFEKGLPANLESERMLLGFIELGYADLDAIEAVLSPDDFSLEKHRRIFARMQDLHRRGDSIDYVTLFNELKRQGEAESCDGLGYLTDLTNGLPQILNLDTHIRIIQEKSTLRRTIFACQHLMKRCLAEDGNSQELLADAEALLSKLAEKRQPHGQWLTPTEVITSFPGGVDAFMSPNRGGTGIPTPWPRLTSTLCGLQKGDLVLLAARPSMGKSVAAMQMAHYGAKHGHGGAFFSLEMTKEALVRRLISAIGKVDAQRLRSGMLNVEERGRALRAASEVEGLPLWIDDTRARTMPAITSALCKLRARHSVEVVFIDHLQLMKSTGRTESRHHELSEISHALKHLANELEVAVVLVSQLNRDCEREKRRPQLADLKETGSLEEDADVVVFIHRPEQYNRQDESLRGIAEFIIGKQRNGPTGKLPMCFVHEHQKFGEGAPGGTGDE